MAIRIDSDVVPVLHDRNRLKIAEVEAGKTRGGGGLVARDSQISFDMVVHGISGGDQGQVFRIPERHVIIGELHTQTRVPSSARSYVVNAIARLQDHLAFGTNLELMRSSRINRRLGDQQDLLVSSAGDQV